MTESQLTAEDLTPRERLVFIASCQLKEVDGPEALIHDPEYATVLERLRHLGWLEAVTYETKEGEALAGYRPTPAAQTADGVASLLEQAQSSTN
jgi:hypothetical protein